MCHLIKMTKKFNEDVEAEKFKELFVKFELGSESWCKFKYRIDNAPPQSEFDFERVVFS